MEIIDQSIDRDVVSISLTGKLIGSEVSEDLIELISLRISNGMRGCIINIEEIPFIDSSGIGLLITILTKLRNAGGELYLVKPSDHVQKLLIMTKLENIFNIAASEEEAIQKLKS